MPRLRLRLPCTDVDSCMQTLRGEDAKSVTKEEFVDHLRATAKQVNDNWPWRERGPPIFMFDGPSFHKLTEEHITDLIKGGLIKYRWQLMTAPRYSGDFMQCVEHGHAIISQAWFKQRIIEGGPETWQEREEQLLAIALQTLTAESVAKNVARLPALLQHIKSVGTGGYPPCRLS